MILLNPAVEVSVLAILALLAEHLSDGAWIRIVPVSSDWFAAVVRPLAKCSERIAGLHHIAGGTQERVHEMAVVIDGTRSVATAALYRQIEVSSTYQRGPTVPERRRSCSTNEEAKRAPPPAPPDE